MEAGTLIVAAAGNRSFRPGLVTPVDAPADCRSVFAFGAIDSQRQLADSLMGESTEWRRGGYYSARRECPFQVCDAHGLRQTEWNQHGDATRGRYLSPYAEANAGITGKQLWNALTQNAQPLPLLPRDVGVELVQAPTGPAQPSTDPVQPLTDPAPEHEELSKGFDTHDPIIITGGGSAFIDFDHRSRDRYSKSVDISAASIGLTL